MVPVPQQLYDSAINFEIRTAWDSGFKWKLGDGMNGFVVEGRTVRSARPQLFRSVAEPTAQPAGGTTAA
jgi:hypothetical protein